MRSINLAVERKKLKKWAFLSVNKFFLNIKMYF